MLRAVEFADLRVSDYAAVVTDRSTLAAVLADDDVLRRMRAALGSYDLLRVTKLRNDGPPMHRLFGVAEAQVMPTNAYAVPLESSFETWRKAYLDPSYAGQIARKARGVARLGDVRFERASDQAAIAVAFDALKRFRHDRFGGGEVLQVPAYFEFYKTVARDTAFARTYQMSLDGRPIACVFGLSHKGTLLIVLPGFTQTELSNKSVGNILLQEIVRDAIAHGDTLLDFTIGDHPYKKIFGARPAPMRQLYRAGSPLGHVAQVMLDRMPGVKALARSLFHTARW
jgi:CelD/BcsL family acetyltransferase involved in cellulose biosynthesis